MVYGGVSAAVRQGYRTGWTPSGPGAGSTGSQLSPV